MYTKVALIGDGYWGSKIKNYIPQFFELQYIVDSKFDKSILWNDKEVEAVFVVTPIETHYDIVKEALLNNKHVFCEKPITLETAQAEELKVLAESRGLKLAVEYTFTFSKAIEKILSYCVGKYGPVLYYEFNSKHLGRFMEHNVYWLLASHFLAVLDMFEDLDSFNFRAVNRLFYNNVCTTGTINFEKGRIETSVNYTGKEASATFYFKNATIIYNPTLAPDEVLKITEYNNIYKAVPPQLIDNETFTNIDESNNLKYAIEYFYDLMNGTVEGNIDTAIKVTRILENI